MNSPTLVTGPVVEPISLAEAKMHLRIDDLSPDLTPDNILISALIVASRQWAEDFQNRAYITQEWDLFLDRFPRRERYIEIPRAPLMAIESLSYYDGTATQTVSFLDPSGTALLETDDYIVDTASEPGRLCLKNASSWPVALRQAKSVQIRFLAGYGDAGANVPEEIKAAIKLKLSDLYENRGDSDSAFVESTREKAVKALLWPRRIVPI